MKTIQGFYIITEDGNSILHHEKFIQGSHDADNALFKRFVVAFQGFLHELCARGSTIIELGNSIIYTIFDNSHQLYFVLKCRNDSSREKMIGVLTKVQEEFMNLIIEDGISVKEMEIQTLEKVRKAILKLITPRRNVENFLAAL